MAWIRCVVCGTALPAASLTGHPTGSCKVCRKALEVKVFPAVNGAVKRPPSLPQGGSSAGGTGGAGGAGATTCFYDPSRVATTHCSHCGVFVSEAWVAKWGDDTVCLPCLDALRSKGSDVRFETRRTLWDNIVLGLSAGPWLLAIVCLFTVVFYFVSAFAIVVTLITAPAALFFGLRYWNASRSLVPRGRTRLVSGLVFAAVQVLAWVMGILALVNLWGKIDW